MKKVPKIRLAEVKCYANEKKGQRNDNERIYKKLEEATLYIK